MVFPVVTYGCESQTVKKAEHQRIDTFKLWCWRRLLRVLWTARRSNQSILKEISPEYSLEGLMLKLKLQYFGHLMWTANSLEKSLMLGKIEGRRRRGHQRMRWLDDIRGWDGWMASPMQWTWTWAKFGRWWGKGRPGCCSPWAHKELDTTGWLNNNNNSHPKGFPGSTSCIESAANAGDTRDEGLIPGVGRSPGGGNGKYSCLGNPMDRGVW